MSYVGKRVEELRTGRQLSQGEVAQAVGVTQKAISLLENDPNRVPLSSTLQNLAHFFDVDPYWLMTGKGPKHPVSTLSEAESELLLLFRAISEPARAYIMSRVRLIHRDECHQSPSPPRDGTEHTDELPRSPRAS